jgi:hypothetical protein
LTDDATELPVRVISLSIIGIMGKLHQLKNDGICSLLSRCSSATIMVLLPRLNNDPGDMRPGDEGGGGIEIGMERSSGIMGRICAAAAEVDETEEEEAEWEGVEREGAMPAGVGIGDGDADGAVPADVAEEIDAAIGDGVAGETLLIFGVESLATSGYIGGGMGKDDAVIEVSVEGFLDG